MKLQRIDKILIALLVVSVSIIGVIVYNIASPQSVMNIRRVQQQVAADLEGEAAGRAGLPVEANPYSRNIRGNSALGMAQAWNAGWSRGFILRQSGK